MKNRLVPGFDPLGSSNPGPEVPEKSRLVPEFDPTRNELAVLARYYLERSMSIEAFCRETETSSSYEWGVLKLADERLARIEKLLGEKEFEGAISETKEKWVKLFADYEEDERACKNDHRSHPHGDCAWIAEEKLSPLAGAFPRITPEQAQNIFDRKPFIGMTLRQAKVAVGCLKIGSSRQELQNAFEGSEVASLFGDWVDGENDIWQISKHAWGTEERIFLMFVGGRLIAIREVKLAR